MSRPAFNETDLLLGQTALDQLSRARTAKGLPPILEVIQSAIETVADYTARYELPPQRWRRLIRPIAVCDLMTFPGGSVTEAVTQARDKAMAELADIRDGKFADLLPAANSTPTTIPRMAFGGQAILAGTEPNMVLGGASGPANLTTPEPPSLTS